MELTATMQRQDWIKIATFLLNAVICLAVWNVTQSIASLKELMSTRIDAIEKRIDRHEFNGNGKIP